MKKEKEGRREERVTERVNMDKVCHIYTCENIFMKSTALGNVIRTN
jgi:hypothetical protein